MVRAQRRVQRLRAEEHNRCDAKLGVLCERLHGAPALLLVGEGARDAGERSGNGEDCGCAVQVEPPRDFDHATSAEVPAGKRNECEKRSKHDSAEKKQQSVCQVCVGTIVKEHVETVDFFNTTTTTSAAAHAPGACDGQWHEPSVSDCHQQRMSHERARGPRGRPGRRRSGAQLQLRGAGGPGCVER